MKFQNIKKEELELLSYTDLTELILKENKKAMNTSEIFKIICDLLELNNDEYTSKIGDYYTSLTTDKRFILLQNALWDLRDKHKIEINLEDDDEDDDSFEEETEEEDIDENEEQDMSESIEINDDEVDLDDEDDDINELSIIDDEDLEE